MIYFGFKNLPTAIVQRVSIMQWAIHIKSKTCTSRSYNYYSLVCSYYSHGGLSSHVFSLYCHHPPWFVYCHPFVFVFLIHFFSFLFMASLSQDMLLITLRIWHPRAECFNQHWEIVWVPVRQQARHRRRPWGPLCASTVFIKKQWIKKSSPMFQSL